MRYGVWVLAPLLLACAHAAVGKQAVAPEVECDGSSCERPIVVYAGRDLAAISWE